MDSIRECSVDGCPRTNRIVRGLCSTHYARFLRHGTPGEAAIKPASWEGMTCGTCGVEIEPYLDHDDGGPDA